MLGRGIVNRLADGVDWRPAAEIDAEICDELEFHIAMRTNENRELGMPEDQARQAAEEQFGDFEASRAACRAIDLGPRVWLPRLQVALLALLVAVVVYQAVEITSLRSSTSREIQSLAIALEKLRAPPERTEAAAMAIILIEPDRIEEPGDSSPAPDLVAGWGEGRPPRSEPWSDWSALPDN
ncbi:MAG: permease prefix domain 1-containing protein [Planctomycetota bacterium]